MKANNETNGTEMVQIEGAKIVRETEKAALVNVMFGDSFRKDVWFPKSKIEIRDGGVFAPMWLLAAKADEVSSWADSIATVSSSTQVNVFC